MFAASISSWIAPIADMVQTEQARIGINFREVHMSTSSDLIGKYLLDL
jgi:hypothetical protein